MKVLVACLFLVAAAQAAGWANVKAVSGRRGVVRRPPAPASRIVGGSLATVGQIKYQVLVWYDGVNWCGGSLIADNVVLTAAHCIYGRSSFEIHAGGLTLYDVQEAGRVIISSTDATVHEGYPGVQLDNDIAVIRLPERISGPNIAPVRVPSRSQAADAFVGINARASGWGTFSDTIPEVSENLQFVDVDIISNEECENYFAPLLHSIVCIDTNNGTKATCSGDSGGPLVITESDGLPTQVGVTSFGSGLGCESGFPSGFTRITDYLDWLETNAGITISP